MSAVVARVDLLDHAAAAEALRQLRPSEDMHEAALDAIATHVIARDRHGHPLGSVRLRPDQRLDALRVPAQWRGRGIASGLLRACVEEARRRGWPRLQAFVAPEARTLFACQGFLAEDADAPVGQRALLRRLDGPTAITSLAAAIDTTCALVSQARRELVVYSRALDPGLLDAPPVLAAFRRFATARHATAVLVLLQDGPGSQYAGAPLLRLAQRLDSTFRFRRVGDPVDTSYPSAYLANESGGYYFRPMGQRFDDGESSLEGAPRSRELRAQFMQVWERSPLCGEFRALGI